MGSRVSEALPVRRPEVAQAARERQLGVPVEAWILAGHIDGGPAQPAPLTDVCGMPHLLRIACAVGAAGAERILVVWNGVEAPPDISGIAADPRLQGRILELVT